MQTGNWNRRVEWNLTSAVLTVGCSVSSVLTDFSCCQLFTGLVSILRPVLELVWKENKGGIILAFGGRLAEKTTQSLTAVVTSTFSGLKPFFKFLEQVVRFSVAPTVPLFPFFSSMLRTSEYPGICHVPESFLQLIWYWAWLSCWRLVFCLLNCIAANV